MRDAIVVDVLDKDRASPEPQPQLQPYRGSEQVRPHAQYPRARLLSNNARRKEMEMMAAATAASAGVTGVRGVAGGNREARPGIAFDWFRGEHKHQSPVNLTGIVIVAAVIVCVSIFIDEVLVVGLEPGAGSLMAPAAEKLEADDFVLFSRGNSAWNLFLTLLGGLVGIIVILCWSVIVWLSFSRFRHSVPQHGDEASFSAAAIPEDAVYSSHFVLPKPLSPHLQPFKGGSISRATHGWGSETGATHDSIECEPTKLY